MSTAPATNVAPKSALPAPFGKYLLMELLAVGGMAEVYRAKIFGIDGFEKQMVVKRILPKHARNPNFVQMFVDEAKIAVQLSHGNIVPIYELGEVEGSYYIAMEYVEGLTILDLLRECYLSGVGMPPAHALYIAAEVAKGLSYAHDRRGQHGHPLGIIHRDVNPRNIVVTQSGEVKILDFGIARASTKRHQTASGVIKGTPGYMSPEQAYGFAIDHRTDVYCLGIILYELLTVRRLFRVREIAQMRAILEREPIAPPSTHKPAIDARIDALVLKLLALRAEDRYQSAAEVEEALRFEIGRLGVAVTSRAMAELVTTVQARGQQLKAERFGGPASAPFYTPGSSSMAPSSASSVGDHAAVSGLAPGGSAPALAAVTTPSRPTTRPRLAPVPAPGPMLQPPADMLPTSGELISQAQFEPPPPAPSPMPAGAIELPKPRLPSRGAVQTQTLVLASNDELAWAANIGSDAELQALLRSGLKPHSTAQVLLVPFLLVLGLLAGIGYLEREQLPQVWQRLTQHKQVRLGSMVIKTYPSGAEVRLDGQRRGVTPLRIDNVDTDTAHELTVVLVGEPAVQRAVTADDWNRADALGRYELKLGYDKLPPAQRPLGD